MTMTGQLPPPPPPETETEEASSQTLHTLQTHIQTLTDAHARLQSIRAIPSLLLHPPARHVFPSSLFASPPVHVPSALRQQFKVLEEIKEELCKTNVQDAFKAAKKAGSERGRGGLGDE